MSGLSVKAVRHYERVGLLQPFEVDPATGYRRYAPEQAGTARTIRRLRDLDVPLARIRTILSWGDPKVARLQLERPDRSLEENDRMVHAAHASRFHWGEVGEPVNLARGEWQISRVYSVLGRSEPAIFHADRCLQICRGNEIGDFDLAFAYEALARAHLVAGDRDAAARFGLSREAGEHIAEEEDRDLLISDVAGISA
jgi:DNA-binding transcriptional MerR regulator